MPWKRFLRSLLGLLKNLVLAWIAAFRALPLAKAILKRRLHCNRPRRRSASRCVPVHEQVYRRPDPLIYSRSYLRGQGRAVTWDKPDISIQRGALPVPAHALLADTDYDIVARLW